jgi:hypothetical protein
MKKEVTLYCMDLKSGKSFEKECNLSFLPQKDITIVLPKSKMNLDFTVGRIYLDPAADKWEIHLIFSHHFHIAERLLKDGWTEISL